MHMSSKHVDIQFTERLLEGAKEGKMKEVTYCLDSGIDIESKSDVRFNDSFKDIYIHIYNIYINIYVIYTYVI
jgi:hypothetical protein